MIASIEMELGINENDFDSKEDAVKALNNTLQFIFDHLTYERGFELIGHNWWEI